MEENTMILCATTKQAGTRFRGIIRLDSVEYHLPGLHASQIAAMDQAKAVLAGLEAGLKKSLKSRTMFTLSTHAGIPGRRVQED